MLYDYRWSYVAEWWMEHVHGLWGEMQSAASYFLDLAIQVVLHWKEKSLCVKISTTITTVNPIHGGFLDP